jgi:hypothetical protein
VKRWLDAYVRAWKSYDPDAIGVLFAERCEYRYHPFDEPLRGRDEIVTSWVEDDPDEPGTYDAVYEPVAVDGDVAVATGSSTYTNADGSVRAIYDNCFVLRFEPDGRCSAFTEWFVQRPEGSGA